jgi:hypothetical protein
MVHNRDMATTTITTTKDPADIGTIERNPGVLAAMLQSALKDLDDLRPTTTNAETNYAFGHARGSLKFVIRSLKEA